VNVARAGKVGEEPQVKSRAVVPDADHLIVPHLYERAGGVDADPVFVIAGAEGELLRRRGSGQEQKADGSRKKYRSEHCEPR
jgi:hypothetical protein